MRDLDSRRVSVLFETVSSKLGVMDIDTVVVIACWVLVADVALAMVAGAHAIQSFRENRKPMTIGVVPLGRDLIELQ